MLEKVARAVSSSCLQLVHQALELPQVRESGNVPRLQLQRVLVALRGLLILAVQVQHRAQVAVAPRVLQRERIDVR